MPGTCIRRVPHAHRRPGLPTSWLFPGARCSLLLFDMKVVRNSRSRCHPRTQGTAYTGFITSSHLEQSRSSKTTNCWDREHEKKEKKEEMTACPWVPTQAEELLKHRETSRALAGQWGCRQGWSWGPAPLVSPLKIQKSLEIGCLKGQPKGKGKWTFLSPQF